MFRRQTLTAFTTSLTLIGLLHCKGSNSEPSKTAADESGPGATTQTMGGAESSSPSNPSDPRESADSMQSASEANSGALDDSQIAAITDAANSAELTQGQLAKSKASDARVRSFATMMVDHHGEAKRDQQALGVEKRDNTESQRLSAEANAALQSLQQKSGAEFDRAYIQLQCEEHRKVLDTIEQKLLPAAKDPGLKAYLQQLKPRVEAHLAEAERLQKDLGSANSKSSRNDGSGAPSASTR